MKMTMATTALAAVVLAAPGVRPAAPTVDSPATALHDTMRKLWIDHVAWTRMYIISAAAGLPDAKPTTDRLLQNQADIGNAVAGYYGAEAGTKLTALLKDHILQAAELVTASKAGDQAKAADAKTRWYQNAEQIAEFLAGANPKHWPVATLKSAMKTHLDQTLEEASDRISGKYDEDIKDYDEIVAHILTMADLLSSGIVKQFPEKFASKP
ncbi:MAG TPA: hypothetical protein VLB00_05670 [Gemmatimonadales bacterium]|nr:hypothetical protein [Gemmatimonadales bacterium]